MGGQVLEGILGCARHHDLAVRGLRLFARHDEAPAANAEESVDRRFTDLDAEPIRQFMAKWQHPGGVASVDIIFCISRRRSNARGHALITRHRAH